ncbi:hypothetical protein ACFWXH_07275 [Mesorhizobium sp. NPDC059054]|uniref:hypothetical protein n=1 Tax=unclassified Mesorhizobium TaxID=325217 RepID=UPI0036861B12
MADSDISTTLPSVTRRRLIAGAAVTSVFWPFGVSSHEGPRSDPELSDAVLDLCQNWQRLHDKTLTLCHRQHQLETDLARTVGFPRIDVQLCDGHEVTVHSIEDLKDLHFPEVEWGRALASLAAQQARWDAADAEIGYSRTDDLIRQAEAAEQALLDDLSRSPVSSIEGILAKLMVIIRNGEHWEDPHNFPWPHIRSVLDDVARHHCIDPTT